MKNIYGTGGFAFNIDGIEYIFDKSKTSDIDFKKETVSLETNNGTIIEKTLGYRFSCTVSIVNGIEDTDLIKSLLTSLGSIYNQEITIYPKLGIMPVGQSTHNLLNTPSYLVELASSIDTVDIDKKTENLQEYNLSFTGTILTKLPSYIKEIADFSYTGNNGNEEL